MTSITSSNIQSNTNSGGSYMENNHPFAKLPRNYLNRVYGEDFKHEINDVDNIYYSTIMIDDKYEVPVYKKEIVNANLLQIVAGTNGYHGGDGGNGGRTFIRIYNQGGTAIEVKRLGTEYRDDGVEIILAGDTELDTIIDGLEFITNVLRCQAKETN